ncbi:hypothetical protein NH340_JMT05409 [Sarcoptes scabiei]|nr:hypothetical protein NH340_JMT05409 [Sarcoptes scabiei]
MNFISYDDNNNDAQRSFTIIESQNDGDDLERRYNNNLQNNDGDCGLNQQSKLCGVCGDKASGYNFNALTCESCKAFFRRNACRNKNFHCPSMGNCLLNKNTRKYCRRCRLKRCFEIGMKKEWILTEEEKRNRMRKYRHRRRGLSRSIDTRRDLIQQEDKTSSSEPIFSSEKGSNEKFELIESEFDKIIVLPITIIDNKEELKNGSTKLQQSDDPFANKSMMSYTDFISQKIENSLKISTEQLKQVPFESNLIDGKDHIQSNEITLINQSCMTTEPSSIQLFPSNSSSSSSSSSSSWPSYSYKDRTEHIWNESSNYLGDLSPNIQSLTNEIIDNSFAAASDKAESLHFDSDGICDSERKFPNNSNSSISVDENPKPELRNDSIKNNENEWPVSDLVYKHAIELEFVRHQIDSLEDRDRITEIEWSKITDINSRFEALYQYVGRDVPDAQKHWILDPTESLPFIEYLAKKMIMILKNIPSFKVLCQEDKIQLLKKSYGAIKFLTHIPFFNLQEESCLLEHVEKEFIVFSRDYIIRTMGEEFYKRFLKFIISFNEDWIKDLTVLNLIGGPFLFLILIGSMVQTDF